jgi:hypothetical protein
MLLLNFVLYPLVSVTGGALTIASIIPGHGWLV